MFLWISAWVFRTSTLPSFSRNVVKIKIHGEPVYIELSYISQGHIVLSFIVNLERSTNTIVYNNIQKKLLIFTNLFRDDSDDNTVYCWENLVNYYCCISPLQEFHFHWNTNISKYILDETPRKNTDYIGTIVMLTFTS